MSDKLTIERSTINCRGVLLDLSSPVVMGIINATDDSFYANSRVSEIDQLLEKSAAHLEAGANIIDIGAMSTRPHAKELETSEETDRLEWALEALIKEFPKTIFSIDTYRARVAKRGLSMGAHMINDIGGGQFDPQMLSLVGQHKAPYVLMHNRVKPLDMVRHTQYEDIILEMLEYFYRCEWEAGQQGIIDIILDPGIGFSKTSAQNFEVLDRLREFNVVGRPMLVGLSRKSFIYKTLDITAEKALNGTTAMHIIALQGGAKIIRTHDTREAMECIALFNKLEQVRNKGI